MAEKDYIERESIYRKIKTHTNPYGKPTLDYKSGVKVLDMIKQEPAADVVEVVRCKDCKYRYSYDGFDRNRQETYEANDCWRLHEDFGDDGFCSYGERREQL